MRNCKSGLVILFFFLSKHTSSRHIQLLYQNSCRVIYVHPSTQQVLALLHGNCNIVFTVTLKFQQLPISQHFLNPNTNLWLVCQIQHLHYSFSRLCGNVGRNLYKSACIISVHCFLFCSICIVFSVFGCTMREVHKVRYCLTQHS